MNALLDVAIGLVFLYLLLALVCTILNEMVASGLGLRAKNLKAAIDKLLADDDGGLKAAFEATGIMRVAYQASGKNGPSYLSAENFTAAIVEVGKAAAVKAKTFSGRIKKADELATCIDALPESNLKRSLATLMDGVHDDVNEAKERIGAWFDSMMDRAAGQFTRRMKQITMGFAIVVTVAFNADTLAVSKALWTDASMRMQLAESAVAFVSKTDDVDDIADLEVLQNDLRPFPIGWDTESPAHSSDWFASVGGVASKILGWLITALAVSLGAPFWFDLLKRLVALRGTGPATKPQQPKAPK